jgi:hypothetical protein
VTNSQTVKERCGKDKMEKGPTKPIEENINSTERGKKTNIFTFLW